MKLAIVAALVLLFPVTAFAGSERQDEPPDINFQFKVDQAIKKGLVFLKGKHIGKHHRIPGGDELILLTYLHAGVDVKDPHFKSMFDAMLKDKLEWTYKVVLQAMVLEEYDRVTYQPHIHKCAQFLVDNISSKGQTRYGQRTIYTEEVDTPTPTRREDVKTTTGRGSAPKLGDGGSGFHTRGPKPKPRRMILVRQKREGPSGHDHSNMQYMALGLRACFDAGIRFEPEVIASVDQHWRDKQQPLDENVRPEPLAISLPKQPQKKRIGRYTGRGTITGNRRGTGSTRTSTAVMARPRGWDYTGGKKPWGSMSVGAVGALCILDYIQGKDWRKDQDVLDGLMWSAKNFSVSNNPERGDGKWYYYYMYGLERQGMLFGTELVGDHKWYREGAEKLIADQAGDGSWKSPVDTCFAILFLRRATHALPVASRGGRR